MGEGLRRAGAAAMLSNGKGLFIRKRDGAEVRVMGVVDGYVVARCKGAMPFLTIQREFLAEFEPKLRPVTAEEREGG